MKKSVLTLPLTLTEYKILAMLMENETVAKYVERQEAEKEEVKA